MYCFIILFFYGKIYVTGMENLKTQILFDHFSRWDQCGGGGRDSGIVPRGCRSGGISFRFLLGHYVILSVVEDKYEPEENTTVRECSDVTEYSLSGNEIYVGRPGVRLVPIRLQFN